MILLVGCAHPELTRWHPHPNLGRLVQPRDYGRIEDTAALGVPWAADNDAFGGWSDEKEARFVRMLDVIAEVKRGCRFVAAPDVVGDADATMKLYARWHDPIHHDRRLPIALVLQDGLKVDEIPWNYLDAVFVGGTTDFKMGLDARDAVAEAKRRGKWAHMGRVNSARRITYAGAIGCDSFDGTCFSKWRDTYVPWGLALAAADRQLAL